MDNLLIEYGEKFTKINHEMRVDFMYHENHQYLFRVNVYLMPGRLHQAGGGFKDPLEMFEYLDILLTNYRNHRRLLPDVGVLLGNSTP